MEFRILKIEGEFVMVELSNDACYVCPKAIFPKEIEVNSVVEIVILKKC